MQHNNNSTAACSPGDGTKESSTKEMTQPLSTLHPASHLSGRLFWSRCPLHTLHLISLVISLSTPYPASHLSGHLYWSGGSPVPRPRWDDPPHRVVGVAQPCTSMRTVGVLAYSCSRDYPYGLRLQVIGVAQP